MRPRKPQCEVFWALLSSSKRSGVLEDSKSPTFPSVGLHPHTWPKWGCDKNIGCSYLFEIKFVLRIQGKYLIALKKIFSTIYNTPQSELISTLLLRDFCPFF
jgi:hypothetical protein